MKIDDAKKLLTERSVSTTLRQLPFEFSVALSRQGSFPGPPWGTSPPDPLGFFEA